MQTWYPFKNVIFADKKKFKKEMKYIGHCHVSKLSRRRKLAPISRGSAIEQMLSRYSPRTNVNGVNLLTEESISLKENCEKWFPN